MVSHSRTKIGPSKEENPPGEIQAAAKRLPIFFANHALALITRSNCQGFPVHDPVFDRRPPHFVWQRRLAEKLSLAEQRRNLGARRRPPEATLLLHQTGPEDLVRLWRNALEAYVHVHEYFFVRPA